MAFIYTRADHLASEGVPTFEPQRMHNWSVIFNLEAVANAGGSRVGVDGGQALSVVQLSLVQGFLPETRNEVMTVAYGNEEVYIAGRAKTEEGRLLLRDFIDAPTASILLNWRRSVYDPQTGAINLARNYKTQASVVLEGPNSADLTTPGFALGTQADTSSFNYSPEFYRVWDLQGCWPVEVRQAAGGLDQTQSQLVLIQMVLRFDKAIPVFAYGGGGSSLPIPPAF